MSKRTPDTTFRAWWPTPQAAAQPLLPYLPPATSFIEPCAGDGALVAHLAAAGHLCLSASDIAPLGDFIDQADALSLPQHGLIITNPPFERRLLVPLLYHWLPHQPAWLLLPTDSLINLWFAPFASYLAEIVPVGRISWLANGVHGKDNHAWLRFNPAVSPFLRPRKPRP